MKIVNTNVPVTKSFNELKAGDVFKVYDGGITYYMKTNQYDVVTGHMCEDNQIEIVTEMRNAVSLNSGALTMICPGTKVILMDCELVIK